MKQLFFKLQAAVWPVWLINGINVVFNLVLYTGNLKKNRVLLKQNKTHLDEDTYRQFLKFSFHEIKHSNFKQYLMTYLDSRLSIIKGDLSKLKNDSKPIVICAVKNDKSRVIHQHQTMKSYGINNFVYIDNGSNDGTREYLVKQDDIMLYETNQNYNSIVRSAWVRKIIHEIGFNKWYLLLDSDEIYVYPNIEEDCFTQFLSTLKSKKQYYVQSILIDMYPEKSIPLKNLSGSNNQIKLEDYCWFDKDYIKSYGRKTPIIQGGPRHRLFSDETYTFDSWLNKVNFIYYTKECFHYSHIVMPYANNHKAKTLAGTLHYKFLPNDFDKYQKIAEQKNYANESKEYRRYVKYLKNKSSINFYNESSIRFENSLSIKNINLISKKEI